MSTKLVIHPAVRFPPSRTLITNFVLSLFPGLDVLYIYVISLYCTYIYIYICTWDLRPDTWDLNPETWAPSSCALRNGLRICETTNLLNCVDVWSAWCPVGHLFSPPAFLAACNRNWRDVSNPHFVLIDCCYSIKSPLRWILAPSSLPRSGMREDDQRLWSPLRITNNNWPRVRCLDGSCESTLPTQANVTKTSNI